MANLIREQQILSHNIQVADSYLLRLRGLLFSAPLPTGNGLLLTRCNSIHMFFMTYAIDVIFLDKNMAITSLVTHIKPWRIASCKQAKHTLELGVGSIELWNLKIGERLMIQ